MAAKKSPPSFLTNLFILLLHIGCFLFTARPAAEPPRKKRKSLSSSLSILTRVFSAKQNPHVADTRPSSPRSSHHSDDPPPRKRRSGSRSETHPLSENLLLPNLLEHHNSTQHAVSELRDGDPSKNVVWIIFNSGWKDARPPRVHRILKIHNSPKTLARFEDYREVVKSKAAATASRNDAVWRRSERCLVDGNELLRFHCTTFACDLGQNGKSALCGHPYCSVCGVIRAGFSAKMDGISTLATGWSAHVAVPDDVEAEFSFMSVKRAMLVCRVVAGRVGCDPVLGLDKGDPGFDSVVSSGGLISGGLEEGSVRSEGENELLVFNPRAVLPCFVIVYSV